MSQCLDSTSPFSVMIASDLDHEKVYAEIYCNDKFVALISQEGPSTDKVLELPGPGLEEEQICRQVDLKGFLNALQLAVQTLEDG